MCFLLAASALTAQNTNTKVVTKTVTQSKKDSDGIKKMSKSEVTKEVQKVKLGSEKEGTINVPIIDSAVEVTKITTVTNPDGSTRTVDVDRSAYYESNGTKFKLDLDQQGYSIFNGSEKYGILRKTSINSYIYNVKDKTSIAYFDINGNLIVETYDPNLNQMVSEKYMLAIPVKN